MKGEIKEGKFSGGTTCGQESRKDMILSGNYKYFSMDGTFCWSSSNGKEHPLSKRAFVLLKAKKSLSQRKSAVIRCAFQKYHLELRVESGPYVNNSCIGSQVGGLAEREARSHGIIDLHV